MQSLIKIVCLCLALASQLNAEATGSLEITGSYFQSLKVKVLAQILQLRLR
jgi:hypothetical protein